MSADAPLPASARVRVVVTGGNAGLGYFASEQLARAGHPVVLAVRSAEKYERAAASIAAQVPDASVEHLPLDLADLDSVARAADRLADLGPVGAVINNAGVVGARSFGRTRQGTELQIGTNHLGHFAWTARILPLLEASAGRIVHVGSIAHRFVRLDPRDPFRVGRYHDQRQYSRSKLAVMLFGFELAERLADAGSPVTSVVAHPGLSLDSLSAPRPGVIRSRAEPGWVRPGLVAQGKDVGAEPLVHAAVGRGVRSGEYWGPDGWMQLRGHPAVVEAKPWAHDRTAAARLWTASERASGVSFALDALG
jgi:NAD(P)-dependent dehydrogenase (short-subunit alcohol dehydrogenase family)